MNMLEGKTILITGASSGIGEATARRAKAYGATPILHGRNQSALRKLAKELAADYVAFDVVDREAVLKAVHDLSAIDALVNCAGAAITKPFMESRDEDWLRDYQTNVLGMVHVIQAIVPLMRDGQGSIVNISSIRGLRAMASARTVYYSASKAAVANMTVALAKELAPKIRVNAVAPGFTKTPMAKSWSNATRARAKSSLVGRAGEPAELAEAILFLASDHASYITGQVLPVDGGYEISGK